VRHSGAAVEAHRRCCCALAGLRPTTAAGVGFEVSKHHKRQAGGTERRERRHWTRARTSWSNVPFRVGKTRGSETPTG
jgi:hypothetical protein